jgi:K+-sensing histidine kinase KdpD
MDISRRLAVGGPRGALGYGVAVAGTALITAPLLAFRGDVSKTTVVLAYLLVVTAAAAAGGLGPGITAAGLGFLAFDVLFLQPYHHVIVDDPQDYLSLAVYLLVAVVVSLLVASSERRRAQAERRERETRMLFDLSTSLVAHGGLEDTLQGVVRTVRSLFELAGCAIVLPSGDRLRLAAVDGEVPDDLDERFATAAQTSVQVRGPAGADLEPGRALTVPMRSGEHVVGALVVVAGGPGSSGFGEASSRASRRSSATGPWPSRRPTGCAPPCSTRSPTTCGPRWPRSRPRPPACWIGRYAGATPSGTSSWPPSTPRPTG